MGNTAHFGSVGVFNHVGIILVGELAPVSELRDGQRGLKPGARIGIKIIKGKVRGKDGIRLDLNGLD